ncbi:class I SAM-dependent DNA methyltransferase [Corynebacterium sp. P6129]|uniref:DNA methyltransferase n=1 Tax=Corynebacterium antarcticum TaxID=2800405 RepID=UPI0022609EC6|nr:DNA methyltransferase [Corynebacterium antarcticum]MCX7492942.1 class I SAM-dependent DNA methyltransferase [Corynebacterium antarcticum]
MADYASIVNVDEFIAEFYLTSDETKQTYRKRVTDRIREWKDDGDGNPLQRFTSSFRTLQTELATLDFDSETRTFQDREEALRTYAHVRAALGYGDPVPTPVETTTGELVGEFLLDDNMVLFPAQPIDTVEDIRTVGPLTPLTRDEKPLPLSAAQLVGEIFTWEEPHPRFAVVQSGRWLILADRESWNLGRFLAVDILLVMERNETTTGGEVQRALCAVAAENIRDRADGTSWWAETIEQSREHSVQVSESLRLAIRRSIEIIANDVLERRRRQGIDPRIDAGFTEVDPAVLTRQCLRYLYRILFLLFAEASPELEILPVGDDAYEDGYGLTRLRQQILDPPVTEKARRGTYLYDCLQVLFDLVYTGHTPDEVSADLGSVDEGLRFENIEADLFSPDRTHYIDEVKLSNSAMCAVLENLLLTPEKSGRDRGFVSYATLGVTELGQVYEGLMSFHGFIAETDLYEVAKNGNAEKGTWVVPTHIADADPETYRPEHFITAVNPDTGEVSPVRHRRGSFVYRQSSRDRERSASFYSPPVITSFTVGQALDELKETERITCAADVLTLSVCEPAMGSGAFAVEAVRQLAELYITMRQKELGEKIPPENRTRELQRIKAYIALHNVYGVDLNDTAVELGEVSLWLDTMTAGLKAPWFGLHLRQGNSLIGARRSVYSRRLVEAKAYLSSPPKPYSDAVNEPGEHVYQFVLPSPSWGAAAEAKDLKKHLPDEIKALKNWAKTTRVKLTGKQIDAAEDLTKRVDELWEFALERLRIAEDQVRRRIDVWGFEQEPADKSVRRAEIEESLADANGAFQRLKLVMDAWCALKFWPVAGEVARVDGGLVEPPTLDEWFATLKQILGKPFAQTKRIANQTYLGENPTWDELNAAEQLNLLGQSAKPINRVFEVHPWLTVVNRLAEQQAFFHWELIFAPVFAEGGFDLQIGNPPWVRPQVVINAIMAELDPWWVLAHKPTQAARNQRTEFALSSPENLTAFTGAVAETVVVSDILGDTSTYPELQGQKSDLYRGFMSRTWSNNNHWGIIALIHPESHFTEVKAAPLRRASYLRLRRHFQFINELQLFDVHHLVSYGVHIYGTPRETPEFSNLTSLYHPSSAIDSFNHDGLGPVPGFKNDNNDWNIQPHKDRIQKVNEETLNLWHSILEDRSTASLDARMVYSVNSEASKVLKELANAKRISSLQLSYSAGWNETTDRKKGYFENGWDHPDSWKKVILQGPHLGISTPMAKQPNPTLKSNKDWSEVDLEAIEPDFIPSTAYQPADTTKNYGRSYGNWEDPTGQTVPVRSFYRVAWRRMAATTGFRTMYPAIIPPGTAHVDAAVSAISSRGSSSDTLKLAASMSSLLLDFQVRSSGIKDIRSATVERLPLPTHPELIPRAARLNCLTSAYAELWEEVMGTPWTPESPARIAEERRQLQVEIDALVALDLGITADELCMIYRTQFPVMRKYDQEDLFDRNGRKVAGDVAKLERKLKEGQQLSEEQRTWTHPQSKVTYTFEYPFRILDREADMRAAYERFAAEGDRP